MEEEDWGGVGIGLRGAGLQVVEAEGVDGEVVGGWAIERHRYPPPTNREWGSGSLDLGSCS